MEAGHSQQTWFWKQRGLRYTLALPAPRHKEMGTSVGLRVLPGEQEGGSTPEGGFRMSM